LTNCGSDGILTQIDVHPIHKGIENDHCVAEAKV